MCIISAIDTRIELEVMQKETKFKIKDFENSAKISPLTKKLDILLSKAESASSKESNVGGEDADASIVSTNEIAKGTTIEASSC